MSGNAHTQLHEDFLLKPSAVIETLNLLREITKAGKINEEDIAAVITDTNYMVMEPRPDYKRRSRTLSKVIKAQPNKHKMTFMRQIDVSLKDRIKVREERSCVAGSFRRLGNYEYRKNNFDVAIEYYTKALANINDSFVLYLNRSLCYIKKRNYKRAILDLDYILNNLDVCCLRAWLYKAGALKRLNNETGYAECVANARRFNSQSTEFIEHFLIKMRSDF